MHRIIARLNIGGPALHVVTLAAGLDAGGDFRTRLLAGRVTSDEGDMAWYAQARGVEISELPTLSRLLSPIQDLRVLWSLFWYFRRDRPLVVHTHTAKAGTLGRIAAFLARVPVRIHTFHGHVLGGGYFSPGKTRLFLGIERGLARISQRLVVLSESQKREMAGNLRIAPTERFSVVPLGLDLKPFQEVDRGAARARTRERLGLQPEETILGIVGRLVPVKNHKLLFQALPLLEAHLGRRIKLLVIGSGILEKDLRAQVRRLGVEDRVLWLGWQESLHELYPALDVLALTSLDEGTPVAILEALAAGTPVAARAVGGVPDILDGVGIARSIPDGTVESVAEVLKETLGLEPGRVELAQIRADVCERYSEKRLVDRIRTLYLEELAAVGKGRQSAD